ncbi:hypothetical protein ACS0TY_001998 [Phlomoides rotata]
MLIFTCPLNLVGFFFFCCYRLLNPANLLETAAAVRRSLFNERITLPQLQSPETKTIFLDLDETLVHSTAHIPPEKYDFVVRPVIDFFHAYICNFDLYLYGDGMMLSASE